MVKFSYFRVDTGGGDGGMDVVVGGGGGVRGAHVTEKQNRGMCHRRLHSSPKLYK